MKLSTLKIGMIVLMIGLVVNSCNDDQTTDQLENIQSTVTNQPECKGNKSASFDLSIANNQSCINYSYEPSSNILTLNHINTGFNCCPGKLSVYTELKGDTLKIFESEETPGCHCNCLFDLNIEVKTIPTGQYVIKVIEPYAEGQDELIFSIDLGQQISGEVCVSRDQYPWGM